MEEGARWPHPVRDRSQWFLETNGEIHRWNISRDWKRKEKGCRFAEDLEFQGQKRSRPHRASQRIVLERSEVLIVVLGNGR